MLRMNSKTDVQLLDERIAEIRRKNEERHKRFLEVEADKQSAAKANALVQLSTPKDNWCSDRVVTYDEEPRPTSNRSNSGSYYDDEPEPLRHPEGYTQGKSQGNSKSRTSSTWNNDEPEPLSHPEGYTLGKSQGNSKSRTSSTWNNERTVYESESSNEPEPLRRPEGSVQGKFQGNNKQRSNTWNHERTVSYENESKPSRCFESNFQNSGRSNTSRGAGQNVQYDESNRQLRRPEGHVRGKSRGKLNSSLTSSGAKCYSFSEGDGPPPDPTYSFLADAERDPVRSERMKRSPRDGMNNRSRQNDFRGGRNFGNDTRMMDAQSHAQYAAWKAERDRVDQERINRQKTADGQWRREWDRGKVPMELDDNRATPRSGRGGGSHREYRDFHEHDNRTLQDFVPEDAGPPVKRGGHAKEMRGSIRGGRTIQNMAIDSQQLNTGLVDVENWNELSNERNVKSVGRSIEVCVSNEISPPVHRVKVNARNVVGTGRVGPRQKVRLSYSSQSEDEANNQNTPKSSSFHEPRCKALPKQQEQEAPSHAVVELAAKPPRPPTSAQSEESKPRRAKEPRVRKNSNRRDSENKKVELNEKEKTMSAGEGNESDDGGDESWEDVTTTSGNESLCDLSEETTPTKKKLIVQVSFDEKTENAKQENSPKRSVKEEEEETMPNKNLIVQVSLDNKTEDGKQENISERSVTEEGDKEIVTIVSDNSKNVEIIEELAHIKDTTLSILIQEESSNGENGKMHIVSSVEIEKGNGSLQKQDRLNNVEEKGDNEPSEKDAKQSNAVNPVVKETDTPVGTSKEEQKKIAQSQRLEDNKKLVELSIEQNASYSNPVVNETGTPVGTSKEEEEKLAHSQCSEDNKNLVELSIEQDASHFNPVVKETDTPVGTSKEEEEKIAQSQRLEDNKKLVELSVEQGASHSNPVGTSKEEEEKIAQSQRLEGNKKLVELSVEQGTSHCNPVVKETDTPVGTSKEEEEKLAQSQRLEGNKKLVELSVEQGTSHSNPVVKETDTPVGTSKEEQEKLAQSQRLEDNKKLVELSVEQDASHSNIKSDGAENLDASPVAEELVLPEPDDLSCVKQSEVSAS